ncbi:hypothetical protein CMI37_20430 [Candidatus Pacearchaeota archaeon]|nr:hypothetical protein [Candidatus Pacearchaeota archaeon]|tara:strand:+ start:3262 stop:3474 length:213 start_codon:yes stop_codon:yes gene_type:complete
MAASPQWKVYNVEGQYLAAFKSPLHAAILIAGLGDGTTLRKGHKQVVYTEGVDGVASECYDDVERAAYGS